MEGVRVLTQAEVSVAVAVITKLDVGPGACMMRFRQFSSYWQRFQGVTAWREYVAPLCYGKAKSMSSRCLWAQHD